MTEVLAAQRKDIKAEFERGFVGVTRQPAALDDLLAAREALISEIVSSTIDLEAAANLPAVRWRQQNLDSLSAEKRGTLVKQREEAMAR